MFHQSEEEEKEYNKNIYIGDTWHVTWDTFQVTPKKGHMTPDKDLVNIVEEISLANYGDFDFVWLCLCNVHSSCSSWKKGVSWAEDSGA